MGHIARWTLETPVTLGFLCYLLVVVPIMGILLVHKYKWQHWEPFSKHDGEEQWTGKHH